MLEWRILSEVQDALQNMSYHSIAGTWHRRREGGLYVTPATRNECFSVRDSILSPLREATKISFAQERKDFSNIFSDRSSSVPKVSIGTTTASPSCKRQDSELPFLLATWLSDHWTVKLLAATEDIWSFSSLFFVTCQTLHFRQPETQH